MFFQRTFALKCFIRLNQSNLAHLKVFLLCIKFTANVSSLIRYTVTVVSGRSQLCKWNPDRGVKFGFVPFRRDPTFLSRELTKITAQFHFEHFFIYQHQMLKIENRTARIIQCGNGQCTLQTLSPNQTTYFS